MKILFNNNLFKFNMISFYRVHNGSELIRGNPCMLYIV